MEFSIKVSYLSKSGYLIGTSWESIECEKEELKEEVKDLVNRLEETHPMVMVDLIEDEEGNEYEVDWIGESK